MKDFQIERWAASVMPGAVMVLAMVIPFSLVGGLDLTFPEIGAGKAVLLATGFLLLSYIVGVALWGLAYWRPLNTLLTLANRHKYRVIWADRYARKRVGLAEDREDGRWMEQIAALVLPEFGYAAVKSPKKCYTVFENAMTKAYLGGDSQLLKRIVWERELIGMLQCLALALHTLWISLAGLLIYALVEERWRSAGLWGVLAVFALALAASAVLHLRLRNRLLARDVVVSVLEHGTRNKDGSAQA